MAEWVRYDSAEPGGQTIALQLSQVDLICMDADDVERHAAELRHILSGWAREARHTPERSYDAEATVASETIEPGELSP